VGRQPLPTQRVRPTPPNANSNTRPNTFDRSFAPPIWRKINAAVAGLCPCKWPGPVELETVLNGRQPPAGRRLPLPARESGGERAGSREAWEQEALVEPADAQPHDAEPNE